MPDEPDDVPTKRHGRGALTPPEMAAATTPRELPAVRTPATPGQVLASIGSAWTRRFGPYADATPLLLLLAQWALETGRGRDCVCWNLGNAKGVPGDGRSWTFFATTEVLPADMAADVVAKSRLASLVWTADGKSEVKYVPPDPATRFRAFGSLDEAAADWLEEEHGSFRGAWAALLTGDPAAFAAALSAEHYMTASAADYAAGLASLLEEFSNLSPDGRHFDLQTPEGVRAALQRLGYYPAKVTGAVQAATATAVRVFQRAAGIEVDGIPGKQTRAALARALLAAA